MVSIQNFTEINLTKILKKERNLISKTHKKLHYLIQFFYDHMTQLLRQLQKVVNYAPWIITFIVPQRLPNFFFNRIKIINKSDDIKL